MGYGALRSGGIFISCGGISFLRRHWLRSAGGVPPSPAPPSCSGNVGFVGFGCDGPGVVVEVEQAATAAAAAGSCAGITLVVCGADVVSLQW